MAVTVVSGYGVGATLVCDAIFSVSRHVRDIPSRRDPSHALVRRTVLIGDERENGALCHCVLRSPQGGLFQIPASIFDPCTRVMQFATTGQETLQVEIARHCRSRFMSPTVDQVDIVSACDLNNACLAPQASSGRQLAERAISCTKRFGQASDLGPPGRKCD
jgi:hypothetical protein